MSTTKHQLLVYLKKNLLCFLDELISQFPTEGELILIRIFLKDQIDIIKIVNYFEQIFLPHQQYIIEKNEILFQLDNDTLFDIMIIGDQKKNNNKNTKKRILNFKHIWNSLDSENKEVMWSWFENFLNITEKYLKTKPE